MLHARYALRNTLFTVWCIFVVACASFAEGAQKTLTVGVALNVTQGTLSSKSPFTLTDRNGKKLSVQRSVVFSVSKRGTILVGKTNLALPVNASGKSPLTFGQTTYRGSLRLAPSKAGVTVINVVGVEDYLRGVLKMEVNPQWPFETLKAQAIIARTYALKHVGRHGDQGFDLCATQHCQVYRGVNAEDPRSDKAIAATKGSVLTYKGALALTPYHSDSGGVTADVSSVWGGNCEYLQAREEPFASESPYTSWESSFSERELADAIQSLGVNVGRIVSLTPENKDPRGRVPRLLVEGTTGKASISTHQLRMALGPTVLRSTVFEISGSSQGSAISSATPIAPTPQETSPTETERSTNRSLASGEDLVITLTQEGAFSTEELMDMLLHPEKRQDYVQKALARSTRPSRPSVPLPATPVAPGQTFHFRGRGWGHGVGLSQWGAKSMAEKGWTCEQILDHYYPGTSVKKVY
jgi:stage II sporulation protein D